MQSPIQQFKARVYDFQKSGSLIPSFLNFDDSHSLMASDPRHKGWKKRQN